MSKRERDMLAQDIIDKCIIRGVGIEYFLAELVADLHLRLRELENERESVTSAKPLPEPINIEDIPADVEFPIVVRDVDGAGVAYQDWLSEYVRYKNWHTVQLIFWKSNRDFWKNYTGINAEEHFQSLFESGKITVIPHDNESDEPQPREVVLKFWRGEDKTPKRGCRIIAKINSGIIYVGDYKTEKGWGVLELEMGGAVKWSEVQEWAYLDGEE